MKHIWILKCTEHCNTQCTGFECQTHLVAVFEKKPEVVDLASFIEGLPNEMGQAVSQIMKIHKGDPVSLGRGSLEYELLQVECGKNLDEVW